MGVYRPALVMRNIIPIVMAGILGIYGLIVAVILSGNSACRGLARGPGAAKAGAHPMPLGPCALPLCPLHLPPARARSSPWS